MAQHISGTIAVKPTIPSCLRCGHPSNKDVAYCTNCGKINAITHPTINAHQQCPIHRNPMVNVCSLCSRPVCKSCYEDAEKTYGSYKCAQCLDKCQELEASYLTKLEQSGKCAKHSNRTRIGKCKSCGFPVCELCGHLWWEGRLFRKIVDGPYCASCNAELVSSQEPDKTKIMKSFLFQDATMKGFKIPSFVFDIAYTSPRPSPHSDSQPVNVSDCPVCGKVVRTNTHSCLHCGEQLIWLKGIPYEKMKYPSHVDQFSRKTSKVSECPLCGDMVRVDWETCPHCGENLHETV